MIWWITSDVTRVWAASPSTSKPRRSATTPRRQQEAIIEAALPRGGSLTGSTDAMDLAVERLTGATLVRVNRSTDELEPWLAESWIAASGNLIYTVKLRPGITSADGTRVDRSRAQRSR